jgi:flagellar hook assembly protein FlgD
MAIFSPHTSADVFASRITVTNPDGKPFDGNFKDGTAAMISYLLNDTATSVSVKILDASNGATVFTISATNQEHGAHSVTWDGSGSIGGKKYYVSITATQPRYSSTNYTNFVFIPTSASGKNIFTRGVDAQRDPKSRGFGYVYAANSDPLNNTRLRTGILRYNADASYAGTVDGDPMLTSTLGITHPGGVFDWGAISPWYSTLDSKGRIYATGNGSGNIYRVDNDSAAPKIIARGLKAPRGLATVGTGAGFKLYIADDTVVVRANLGTSDTLSTKLDTVAVLGNYVRDVIVDDAGYLIAALRAGSVGGPGIAVERYNISGTLPVHRVDATWSIPFTTGNPIGLALKGGSNSSSASDDTLYVSVRGADGTDIASIGIHEISSVDGVFPVVTLVFKPWTIPGSAGGNISANADLTIDYAGNLILFENGNEEIFMVSPPSSTPLRATTTPGRDTVSVSVSLLVGRDSFQPRDFVVNQNYPNPFNPSTTIGFSMPVAGHVRIGVYDMLGREVALLQDEEIGAGYHSVVWDASNNLGARTASGMYLYRVVAQLHDGRSFSESRRMMLLK